MTENVVALHGSVVPLPRGEVVPEIVEKLRNALNLAEAGDLRALAIAHIIDDNTGSPIVETCICWGPVPSRHLYFAVSRLKHAADEALL